MKVRALYSPDVLTAHPGEDLALVASRMQFHEVGALAVYDGERLDGIITERDILRAMGEGRDPDGTLVREYMTPDPITVDPDTEVTRAAAIMLEIGARHLPVVERGKVIGIVSARDFLTLEAWNEPSPAFEG